MMMPASVQNFLAIESLKGLFATLVEDYSRHPVETIGSYRMS